MTGILKIEPDRLQEPLAMDCYDRWLTSDGETAVQFFRQDRNYVVRFLDQADFTFDPQGGPVTCFPVPGTSAEFVADLHFNQIVPLILSAGGAAVLHASAVAVGHMAIGFVGATGRGKSTLAATMARMGYPFLTDDGLIIEHSASGYAVLPRRPILRLRADSEAALRGAQVDGSDTQKEHVAASSVIPFAAESMPLGMLLFLNESTKPQQPTIEPVGSASALDLLLRHSFILDSENRQRMRLHFESLAQIARSVPCRLLDFDRQYSMLPAVVEAVVEQARQLGAEL